MNDLADRILDPVGRDAFFADHWERAPLHIARDDATYFADVLSLDSLERLLSVQPLRFPDVQATRQGRSCPLAEYTDQDDRILPRRLMRLHAEGATVIVSQAHRYIESLARLQRTMLAALQLNCQTNVYLSPPGQQGFNPHYDAHEVLILQVDGSKCFRFYGDGVPLPMVYQRFDSSVHRAGDLQQEIVLTPGDTLYIPRGVMHDAVAMPGASSLHITLGIFPTTLADLLRELVQIGTERDVTYRRSVPRGHWVPDKAVDSRPGGWVDEVSALLAALAGAEAIDDALSRLRDGVALEALPDCQGTGDLPRQLASLDTATRIAFRPARLINREWHGDRLVLRTAGEVLELQGEPGRALDWLAAPNRGTCRVGELPGLDAAAQRSLCLRLLESGLLDVVS